MNAAISSVAAQAKCRSTDGTGKAVVLASNIERVDEGTTGEFRHKYATAVSEHGSFMGKALNCVNVDEAHPKSWPRGDPEPQP